MSGDKSSQAQRTAHTAREHLISFGESVFEDGMMFCPTQVLSGAFELDMGYWPRKSIGDTGLDAMGLRGDSRFQRRIVILLAARGWAWEEQRRDDEDSDTTGDSAIGNIEGRPLEGTVVEEDEVHDFTPQKTVDQIAGNPSADQCQGHSADPASLREVIAVDDKQPEHDHGEEAQEARMALQDTPGSTGVPEVDKVQKTRNQAVARSKRPG